MSIKWRMIWTLGPFLILTVVLLTLFSQWGTQKLALQKARAEAALLAREEAPKVLVTIDQAVDDTRIMGEMVVALHQNGLKDREALGGLLRAFLEKNRDYQGVWIVWEPDAFDGGDAKFAGHPYSGNDGSLAMYWYQDEAGKIEVTGVNVRDKTFYTIPKASRKLTLVEPYLDPAAQPPVLMTTIAQPLLENGKVVGVFGIDIALNKLSEAVSKLKPYGSGFAVFFSDTGTIVAAPGARDVGKGLDALPAENTPEVRSALKSGTPLIMQIVRDGAEYLTIFTPVEIVPGAPAWSLEVGFPFEQVMAGARRSLWEAAGLGAAAVLLVILVLLVGAQRFASPLKRLASYASAVAEGEQNVRLDARGFKGEFVILHRALAAMVANLMDKMEEMERHRQEAEHETALAREVTRQADEARRQSELSRRESLLQAAGQFEDVAEAISSAAERLSGEIRTSGEGTVEQTRQVAETATAMEEMNATVVEVSRNAESASSVSVQTRQKASDGADIAHKAVTSIQQVQQQSLALKDDMATLSEHAQSISRIMGVISDIADQTNLLALNAAIEAARAGDAGRGFAVVADEVRKLADKTTASTTDVGNAIRAIQQSTGKSMSQVDAAVQGIEQARDFANRSGAALDEIARMAGDTADQVNAIALACEQQSASSEEINGSINKVNTIAGENARAMEEASRAVSDLLDQTRALTGLIDRMKQS